MGSTFLLLTSSMNPPISKGANRNARRLELLFLEFLLADKLTQI